jgi:hypothetical protein
MCVLHLIDVQKIKRNIAGATAPVSPNHRRLGRDLLSLSLPLPPLESSPGKAIGLMMATRPLRRTAKACFSAASVTHGSVVMWRCRFVFSRRHLRRCAPLAAKEPPPVRHVASCPRSAHLGLDRLAELGMWLQGGMVVPDGAGRAFLTCALSLRCKPCRVWCWFQL